MLRLSPATDRAVNVMSKVKKYPVTAKHSTIRGFHVSRNFTRDLLSLTALSTPMLCFPTQSHGAVTCAKTMNLTVSLGNETITNPGWTTAFQVTASTYTSTGTTHTAGSGTTTTTYTYPWIRVRAQAGKAAVGASSSSTYPPSCPNYSSSRAIPTDMPGAWNISVYSSYNTGCAAHPSGQFIIPIKPTLTPARYGYIKLQHLSDGRLKILGCEWNSGSVPFHFGPPTLVSLVDFEAVVHKTGVHLSWTTAAEIDTVAFHIQRQAIDSTEYERLTATPIKNRGTPTAGASYSWVDHRAEPGKQYRYRLESIDSDGGSRFHELGTAHGDTLGG